MRVAVIGGTGFIGQHVARALVTAGAEVTTIGRGTRPTPVAGTESMVADRHDIGALTRALGAAAPRVVIDMIAHTQGDADGLLGSLPPSVARLLMVSSCDVYWTYGAFLRLAEGTSSAGPLDERAPLRSELFPYRRQATGPADLLYSYDKILVERAVQTWAHGSVTVLRLPMVYGPNDVQRRVAGYLGRLERSNGSFQLNPGEAAWSCTRGYVEDVAAAIGLAALDERASGATLNVGEPDALSELDWVRAIAAADGWPGQVVVDPEAAPSRPACWECSLTVNTTRIRELLGYSEGTGREEGLRRTVAAARQDPQGV